MLRRARPDDAAHAARVIAAALAEHGITFEPAGRDADVALFGARDDHDDLVAEDAHGEVVGVASVGPQGDPGVAWVSKVFVARTARGRGLGRALLEAAHDAARARGYREVGLRTRVVFREAVALYESAGYARQEPSPALVGAGDLVYRRRL